MESDKNQGGKRQATSPVQARTYASIMGGGRGRTTGRRSKAARPKGTSPMKGQQSATQLERERLTELLDDKELGAEVPLEGGESVRKKLFQEEKSAATEDAEMVASQSAGTTRKEDAAE